MWSQRKETCSLLWSIIFVGSLASSKCVFLEMWRNQDLCVAGYRKRVVGICLGFWCKQRINRKYMYRIVVFLLRIIRSNLGIISFRVQHVYFSFLYRQRDGAYWVPSCLRLYLSLHFVHLHCFLACSLRSSVVDPLQDSQPVFTRQAVQVVGGPKLGVGPHLQPQLHKRTHEHAHKTLCNPWARSVSSSPLVSTNTQNILSLSFSLPISLCALIATHPLHTSPERAGRINGPSGENWRVVG